jgi:3-keto-5-aminohexanoate cleavage enzyme
MSDKVVLTCALTGVLTDPKQFNVPVTPEQMAKSARGAFDAGASVMHIHFRQQQEGKQHLPSWDPDLAYEIVEAVRQACPGVIINQSTGVVGPDISGPVSCLKRLRPDIAACNAGTLNYLKAKENGCWAWPPLIFDNPVEKVDEFLKVMQETNSIPEFECFDTGIVRSVALFKKVGMFKGTAHYNFVMGVSSGMALSTKLLSLLVEDLPEDSMWQVTTIGREDVWKVQQCAAELGGNLRTGLEDTFYLPDGQRAKTNAELVEALAECARKAGREIATPDEARRLMHVGGIKMVGAAH